MENSKKISQDLIEIKQSDQDLRELFTNKISEDRKIEILKNYKISNEDFKEKGWKIVELKDSLNLKKIEKIIYKYGYPGKKMVGEELSMVAWLVIQHSRKETLEKYFPIILKANKEKDLDDIYIALMTDRLRMYKGEKQIYGTQVSGKMIFNKISQREEWVNFIWPIENPEKVNELRKKVGIKTTIEEFAKSMNLEYVK